MDNGTLKKKPTPLEYSYESKLSVPMQKLLIFRFDKTYCQPETGNKDR